MTFEIDYEAELPDRVFVEINHRYDIAIEHTETGLSLRVYPRTDGQLWDNPFAAFEVQEAEVVALERDMSSDSSIFGSKFRVTVEPKDETN